MIGQVNFLEFLEFVNLCLLSAQFQGVKVSTNQGRGSIAWSFFPKPTPETGTLVLALNDAGVPAWHFGHVAASSKSGPHPLSNYLKAHFLSKHVSAVRAQMGSIVLEFEDRKIRLTLVGAEKVEITAERENAKAFRVDRKSTRLNSSH